MNGLLAALRSELHVGLHTLGSKLVIVTPALLVALQYFLTRLTAAGTEARDNLLGQNSFDQALTNNAWGYFVDGLSTGLTLLGLLLVALSAYSFSFDRDTGALRHLLIRRVSRPALVVAKLIYFHLLAVLAIVLLTAVCYFLSGSLWEFGPVVEDGFELIGEQEIREEIALGLRLALLPLPAAIALGVLVSVVANSATSAVTGALGITLAMDIFKGMLGGAANYLYARFQPSLLDQSYLQDVGRLVRGYSDVLVDERLLQLNTWVPWPALALFVALALLIVRLRKL
ncbi:MAG: ABC transporter permease subunit [Pseudohongiellaceae bacterium]|jgi:ABC-type transport system involved in multi-copper enzyme maturation permease subunit